ncbi:MAG TPA: hypothetical protein VKT17_11395, partial [Acidobacteriota bacterium]|nr:hypothetical protein [Acidobacteriota bacterium]
MTATRAPRTAASPRGRAFAVLALAWALMGLACRGGPSVAVDPCRVFACDHDGIVRGDPSVRRMSLI